MNFEAIIVDDEPKLRELLHIKLSQHCPEIQVLGMCENVDDAYEKITLLKPKLVFLDIAMPGSSGFDLLDKFESINFEVIFVTGFNEYALDALKVSAVDYVLKPISTESLKEAVAKAKSRIIDKYKADRYDALKHNINNIGDQKTKIAIPGNNVYEFVIVKNIIRCEGWQKYTKIYLADQRCIVSSYNIGVFKEMLESYGFYSTHKSHLINKQAIEKYLKEGTVILTDGSHVPVARRRKEDFMENVINK